MSAYPDLRDVFEGFADCYMRMTSDGSVLAVEEEELRTLSSFLVMGIVDWVESGRSSAEGHRPAIGEFLEDFANQYPRGSDVGAAFKITDEELYGLGLFFARGFVGWILKLDQDRGRFSGFDDLIKLQRSGAHGPLRRRLIAGVLS